LYLGVFEQPASRGFFSDLLAREGCEVFSEQSLS
jgi:hypothetical protein